MGAILARLACRRVETAHRSDGGELRLIARGASFQKLLGEAFDQIRQNAHANVAVYLRLLGVIEAVVPMVRSEGRRQALREQVTLIAAAAERGLRAPEDLAEIQAAIAGVILRGRAP